MRGSRREARRGAARLAAEPAARGAVARPDLHHARVADPGLERGLPCGGGTASHRAVAQPERRPVPRAGDALLAAEFRHPTLVQRPAQVRALVGEHAHLPAGPPHGDQAEVAELAADRTSVRQV